MIAATFTPLEYSEFILLGAGVLILIASAARLVRAPRSAALHSNPTLPRFTVLDILIVFLVSVSAGELIARATAPPASSTQPASVPAAVKPTPVQYALASVISPAAGIAVALILAGMRVAGGIRAWGLNADRFPRALKIAALAYLAVWPVCAGALWLTRKAILHFDPAHHFDEHSTLGLLRSTTAGPLWIPICLVLGAAVCAPLYEELFFRGMIQSTINRYSRSPWTGVAASAAIFGLFHFSNIETVPPLIIFGLALGYAYARTGSLTTSFLMHMFFNAKTLVWLFCGAEP